MSWTIDPDIRKAHTLPSVFYTDERYFELSKERIFARSWQFLCNESEAVGLRPFRILPELLDEPVLLSRNNGDLKSVSNVCTHRGKVLVEESCDANLIRCGYHGRRFSLDGKFLSMPEFEGVENFPSSADDLSEIPLASAGGFLFCRIGDGVSIDDLLSGVREVFDQCWPQPLVFAERKEYHVNAHWALYCENYLEGFHIPYVHKGLNAIVDYGSYTTETFAYSSVQTALSEPPASVGGEHTGAISSVGIAARYVFIFPNLMFNFYPWGVSVNVVRPVTPSKSVVEFLTYVSDESLRDQGAGADLHGVELEDEAVVESVQVGIRSRFYDRGRYSPTREQGTHHFHRLIAEFMSEAQP